MDKQTALARIEEIFRLAAEGDKALYGAWKDWSESSPSDEGKYLALVRLVYPNRDIAIGMPLAHSSQVSLWRACDVIQKMIAANEPISDWKFAEFILRDDAESRLFLNVYFRVSQGEKKFSGVPSLQRRLLGKVETA